MSPSTDRIRNPNVLQPRHSLKSRVGHLLGRFGWLSIWQDTPEDGNTYHALLQTTSAKGEAATLTTVSSSEAARPLAEELLNMPGEIRNIIYQFMRPKVTVNVFDSKQLFASNSLALVNKQIRRESREFYFTDTIFFLDVRSFCRKPPHPPTSYWLTWLGSLTNADVDCLQYGKIYGTELVVKLRLACKYGTKKTTVHVFRKDDGVEIRSVAVEANPHRI